MFATHEPKQNRILAALPAAVYRRLQPHLTLVTLALDNALFPTWGKLHYAYFPTTSVVTLAYAVEEGMSAKAWPVGNEGMVGISSFLGGASRSNQAEVQIAGHAFRIDAQVLRAEFRRGGEFQKILLGYVMALITQASQLGVCGLYHSTDRRLCRFLLRSFDRMPTTELALTQQRIAKLLGVRRVGITQAAGRLQAAGIIHYRRGHIRLLSRHKLEAQTCTCYAVINEAFGRLAPPTYRKLMSCPHTTAATESIRVPVNACSGTATLAPAQLDPSWPVPEAMRQWPP